MDSPAPAPRHILFYDGVCRFCNSTVQLALRHDARGLWRFAPLQGDFAAQALAQYDVDAADLDRIYAIADHGTDRARLLAGSDAGALLWSSLGWPLAPLGWLLRLTPRFLRERVYAAVARRRYRWWGRYDACKLPSDEQADLFLL